MGRNIFRGLPLRCLLLVPWTHAVGAVAPVSLGQAFLHLPGIWFPFGVGLSITECASVIFVLLLSVLLLRRLWSYPRPTPMETRA